MRNRKGKNDLYGVVGVGRFGLAVAQTLLELGKDVIAIDINQQRLRPLEDTAADVFVIEEVSMEAFEDAGLRDCRCVVIGVGKDIEASILAALNAKEMGIERVVCKVINKEHAKILEKIGVEVIFPELETGARLAVKMVSNLTEDIFAISNKFSIIQMHVSASYDGRSVVDANLRKRFGDMEVLRDVSFEIEKARFRFFRCICLYVFLTVRLYTGHRRYAMTNPYIKGEIMLLMV